MTKINCRTVRREIDEAEFGAHLSLSTHNHMKQCRACETFCEERTKLREMVSTLGIVAAPGDFEFRLRARLAGETPGPVRSFLPLNLSFGVRAAGFALVLMVAMSAFVFVNFRSPSNNDVVSQPRPETQGGENGTAPRKNIEGGQAVAAREPQILTAGPAAIDQHGPKRRPERRTTSTRDLASTSAPVLRLANTTEGSNVFPIAASNQKLRLSVDNGRGSSRTISLPTVSFGSQRSVSQNPSALMASARDAW